MSNGNGFDDLDGSERLERARLVNEMREPAARTIERSEQLCADLKAQAPGPDARLHEAPSAPPEPLQEQRPMTDIQLAAMLRAEIE